MAKVVKFPIPTPEKFGPQRVSKKKEIGEEKKPGQLNLFAGGKIVPLNKLSDFEEALFTDQHGDSRDAKKLYLKAIDSGDSLADAYCNLGIIEWQEGNQSKAVDYFTLALKNEPRHFEAHYNLANLYSELGNFPLATAHYKISIELEPTFPNSYFNLALTHAVNREFNDAINLLRLYRELTSADEQKQADELIHKLLSAL